MSEEVRLTQEELDAAKQLMVKSETLNRLYGDYLRMLDLFNEWQFDLWATVYERCGLDVGVAYEFNVNEGILSNPRTLEPGEPPTTASLGENSPKLIEDLAKQYRERGVVDDESNEA